MPYFLTLNPILKFTETKRGVGNFTKRYLELQGILTDTSSLSFNLYFFFFIVTFTRLNVKNLQSPGNLN